MQSSISKINQINRVRLDKDVLELRKALQQVTRVAASVNAARELQNQLFSESVKVVAILVSSRGDRISSAELRVASDFSFARRTEAQKKTEHIELLEAEKATATTRQSVARKSWQVTKAHADATEQLSSRATAGDARRKASIVESLDDEAMLDRFSRCEERYA